MRRWIHSLIVALLCLTLFVDTAKACWFRRHRGRTQTCRPATCPPACGQSAWQDVPVGCEGSMAAVVVADGPLHDENGMIVHESPAGECCSPCTESNTDLSAVDPAATDEGFAVEQSVVERGATATQPAAADVVVHGPTIVMDTTRQPTAAAEKPMTLPPQPADPRAPLPMPATLPDLKPAPGTVAPASGEKPMPESPAPADPLAPSVPPAAPAAPMAKDDVAKPDTDKPAPADEDLAGEPATPPAKDKPRVENLFDEFDDEKSESSDDEPAPAAEPAEDEEMAGEESADGEPAAPAEEKEEMEADESADDDADEKPAADAEDGKDADEEEPAAEEEGEAAFLTPGEPIRQWADATGEHQVMGWLVSIRGDAVRILKLNGRHTTVTLETLSAQDRDYATGVAARVAAERRGEAPAAHETAGL